MTQTPSPTTTKPWYRTWWAITIGALLAIGFIGAGFNAITGNTPDTSSSADTSTSSMATEAESAAEPVAVPDVVGQDGATARETLTGVGFTVTFDGGKDAVIAASNWTVESQTPAAGEELAAGEAVTLAVSKPEAAEAPAAAPDLAARTQAAYINAWGVTDLAQLAGQEGISRPVWAITAWEDMYAGTIRVYVQEPLDSAVAKEMGENILSLTRETVPDLSTVVIQDANGIDTNAR